MRLERPRIYIQPIREFPIYNQSKFSRLSNSQRMLRTLRMLRLHRSPSSMTSKTRIMTHWLPIAEGMIRIRCCKILRQLKPPRSMKRSCCALDNVQKASPPQRPYKFWQSTYYLLGRIPILCTLGINRQIHLKNILSVERSWHAVDHYGLGYLSWLCWPFQDNFIVNLFTYKSFSRQRLEYQFRFMSQTIQPILN